MKDIDAWLQTNLFDEVPVSICVIDRDFKIVKANRRFNSEYGQATNRQCYEVYKGRETRCENCAAMLTFDDGRVRSREEQGADRNGSKSHYLVQIAPITRSRGDIPYLIELSTDLTPVKK